MKIACFGFSHTTAPMSLLEANSLDAEAMREFLREVRDRRIIRELMGLSTCNRTEFLFETPGPEEARNRLLDALSRRSGVPRQVLAEHSVLHIGPDAVRHLFQIASGVDSMIVGEREILGQLREAVSIADSAGSLGKYLSPLMTRCLRVGRRSQSETRINRGNVSVASVAVGIVRKVFEDLSRKQVLIIGAGDTARTAMQTLSRQEIGQVVVANRTLARGECLARDFGGRVVSLERVVEELPSADVVIAATGSPDFLVTRRMVEQSAGSRQWRTAVMLDLSMPRNIDPEIGKLDHVFLYGIDDLQFLARENRARREAEIDSVENILDEEVEDFLRWLARVDVEEMVANLRRRVEHTRRRHLERHAKHLSPELRHQYDMMSESLLRSVLHDLTRNLRRLDPESEEGRLEYQMACRLLNLPPEKPEY